MCGKRQHEQRERRTPGAGLQKSAEAPAAGAGRGGGSGAGVAGRGAGEKIALKSPKGQWLPALLG